MNFDKAIEADVQFIDKAIREEFPYVEFSKKTIEEKISSNNFLLLKAHQNNIFCGFLELEFFLEKDEARLNAVFVEEPWRGQKIATGLVKKAIRECRVKHLNRIFLLVKEGNIGAKILYKDCGFKFEKIHSKVIEDETVEVWGINF